MLVPRFSLSQTDKEVLVTIKLPYVRVGDAELFVEGRDLAFYCKPYLLKLHFPHTLRGSEEEEGSHCRAVYDADLDHGTMTLHLEKAQPGQDFPDLDLTTSLLQPVRAFDPSSPSAVGSSGAAKEPPTIEVLRSDEGSTPPHPPSPAPAAAAEEETVPAGSSDGPEREEAAAPGETLPSLLGVGGATPRYGFNRSYSGVFRYLREEAAEVLRVPDPEGTPEGARTILREAEEAAQFDGERYLGDLVEGAEDPLFQEAMAMQPFYLQKEGEMGEEERAELASFRNKEFLSLTPAEEKAVALGLLDLLLAFAYDHRTTGGEPTVESCWTLATLSPALCWLETWRAAAAAEGEDDDNREPPSVSSVARSFYRRSLTYPYLRLWALSERCVADVRAVLLAGDCRRLALRCLLRVRRTLRRTEAHYLLNRILLDDYCAFLQQAPVAEPVLALLREGVAACGAVRKGDVGLGLPALEAMLEEEEEDEKDSSGSDESDEEDDDDEEEEEEESESFSGGETESEADEDSKGLVEGLMQVRLEEGREEGGEEEEGIVKGLASLSMAGQREGQGEHRESPRWEVLEVRPPPSLLVAIGAGNEESCKGQEGEAGRKRRPLVEELG